MIMQNTRTRWLLVLPAVVCVVALAIVLVVLSRNEPRLFPSIGPLELKRTIEGAEASAMIDHLHGKGVTPQSNLIGMYAGEQGSAVLYMSVYASDIGANDALRKMRSLISAGNPIFNQYSEMQVGRHQVFWCLGQGQIHYFFSHGKQLLWLAVDSVVAHETVENLVGSVTGKK